MIELNPSVRSGRRIRKEPLSLFKTRIYCSAPCRRSAQTGKADARTIAAREQRIQMRAEGTLIEKEPVETIDWEPFERIPVQIGTQWDRCWSGHFEHQRCIRPRGHYHGPGPGASPHEDVRGRKWFGSSPTLAARAADDADAD